MSRVTTIAYSKEIYFKNMQYNLDLISSKKNVERLNEILLKGILIKWCSKR